MRHLRSVGGRLSLALLLVVAVALGVVYLVVVPPLRDRLVDTRLSELERAAPALADRYGRFQLDEDFVEYASERVNARAVILSLASTAPPLLLVQEDSLRAQNAADLQGDPVARAAALSGEVDAGIVTRRGERFGEAAVPIPGTPSQILLLSASIEESLENVEEVQRRLVLAGVLALLVALAIGYGGAWLFARRIRRLEQAAERIAAGRFDEPVIDPHADELGELAQAFDHMRQRLARLDDARKEFVANASHELRTPLFSLGGFLELLGDEDVDESTRRDFLDEMRKQVDRLTRLAADLLDLSRVDAGRLTPLPAPVDLGAVAAELGEEFSAVAQATGHPLEVARNGAVAIADEERVLQIGRALVENALLHTPAGTPVRVRASASGGRAELAVEDEGPGVPAAEREQIFERFYRVDGTKASGSGLGLSIARELAHLMDGEIELESSPERTEFRLSLPAMTRAREPAYG